MTGRATQVATDPLGAIRAELVGAAQRRTVARRRRHRAVTTVATAMLMLVSVGGAGAVVTGTTGVPAVDGLLKKIDFEQEAAKGPGGSVPAIVPGDSSSASDPLELSWGAEPEQATAVAYLSRGGPICFALAKHHGEGVSEARGGVRDCVSQSTLTQRLADDTAFIAGGSFGEVTVLDGYTAADVESLAISGPEGEFDVKLGDVWTPDLPNAQPVRAFVALADVDGIGEARGFQSYSVEARMEDGRTVEIRP